MAEAMTYNSLVQDIQDYAERSDSPFLAQIPRFIMMCENRIASEVRGLGYEKFVTSNLVQGNSVLKKPARWRETAGMYITVSNNAAFLKQRALPFLKSYWPNSATQGVPEYYSDYDYEHFLIAPTPNLAYEVQINYFERPVPLDSTNQVNWTTQYAPQLLLYGTLLEAQPFLKLASRIPEFQTLYDRAAQAVQAESQRRLVGDQSLIRTTA